MIKSILKFFGYIAITPEELQAKDIEIEEARNTIKNNHDFLFEFHAFKPELTYDEYCDKNNLPKSRHKSHEHWNAYWHDQYAAHHIAVAIRKLSMHPELLKAFLEEFASFDWKGTAQFMKDTNWTYGGEKDSPTIERLQYAVISLAESGMNNYENEKNAIQSGGFTLAISYIQNKPHCKISFQKSDVAYLH